MNLIKNLKTRNKFILLLLLLLIPMSLSVISLIGTKIQERENLKQTYKDVETTTLLVTLIHELQKEYALAGGYLSSNGEEFGTRWKAQIQSTDEAFSDLINYTRITENSLPEEQYFSDLNIYRKKIDELDISLSDFENYYSSLRDGLINRIKLYTIGIGENEMKNQLEAQYDLLTAKQYLGRIRTLFNRILISKSFTQQEYDLFGDYTAIYFLSIQNFLVAAPEEVFAFYEKEIRKGDILEVNNLLQKIKRNPATDLSGFDAESWFDKITSDIEGLRNVESYFTGLILSQMNQKINQKERILFLYLGIALISVVLSTLLAIYIIRFFIQNIHMLTSASGKIALGYPDVFIPVNSKDEFGVLASSFSDMVKRSNELSKVAEEVGNGNYQVEVPVKSESDVLGQALINMKKNLLLLSKENEKRNWLLTGISKLNDMVTGANDLELTAKKIIDFLCFYLKCDAGIFFINDDRNIFKFIAGYGIDENSSYAISFKTGEGLTGEAVLKKKIISVTDVRGKYLRIKSALSDIEPFQIVSAPLVFDEEVPGLIEFATRYEFSETDMEFLKEVSYRIAIIFNTIRSNLQTRELLDETQTQAEELETQQEELRQMNDILKRQAEHLQASEDELKANQDELHKKNEELEFRNKMLQDAQHSVEMKVKEVESVSRYKTEFLANMSHELRTPLNSILILSKLLMDETAKSGLEKQSEHARVIHNSGVDLLRLVNEILDLSKIEAKQISLDIKESYVTDIVGQKEFDTLAAGKQIDFKTIVKEGVPERMVTDEFRVKQILRNILSNAFKFTPDHGKITLTVFSPEKNLKYRSENLNDQKSIVAFEIKDTGIGITPEQQNIIFEAFQQGDASTTRKFGGTGLGLSISRELATLLGGEIHLESEVEKGSKFTLYLPAKFENQIVTQAVKADPEKIENKPKPLLNKDHKKKILIIEDDKGFNQILAEFAESKNFEIMQAFTGQEGLEMLEEKPDALLLDIHLPDMNGWDILKHIKAENRLKTTQVHVMSAYDMDHNKKEFEYDDYLPKPITLEKLNHAFATISEKGIQKVLIIEDNVNENEAVAQLLKSAGINSVKAFSGKEGITILEKNSVDAVILDLLLPDMDGYEVMEKTRKMKDGIPIIIYSGKDMSREEEIRLKKYANTIIIKNEYSYQRLMDEVKLFLHRMEEKIGRKQVGGIAAEGILKGKKAMIVDDDVRNVYSLFNILEGEGMEIAVANDGIEALKKLEEVNDPDIILMDIMMPEMDGIECIKAIRTKKKYKNLPIIALTAKAMKSDREKCMQAGASDYISKPVNIEKLLSLMKVWIYDRNIRKR